MKNTDQKLTWQIEAEAVIAKAKANKARATFGAIFGREISRRCNAAEFLAFGDPKTGMVRRAVWFMSLVEELDNTPYADHSADRPTRGQIKRLNEHAAHFRAAWESKSKKDLITGQPLSHHMSLTMTAGVPHEYLGDARQMFEEGACDFFEGARISEATYLEQAISGRAVLNEGERRNRRVKSLGQRQRVRGS